MTTASNVATVGIKDRATYVAAKGGAASLTRAARAPTNKMGTPEDIANTILFLASDESKFATDAMFTVDGGRTAW